MDKLLELSTNLYLISGIFIITLVALHYFFVFRSPFTLRQWKLSEYAWVALALFSIVGVLEEAKFLRANQSVESSRVVAETKMQTIENWFEVYRIYACDEPGAALRTPVLCDWITVKSSDLSLILANESFPVDIPANFLLGIDKVTDGIQDNDRRIIAAHIDQYIKVRGAYVAGMEEARRSDLSKLLVSLAPILFALAVALKFTKVTGEYRLTRK